MKAKLRHDKALRFIGTSERGHETVFDTTVAGGGLDTAASPVDILLQAAAACSSMDVVAILGKQRKTIGEFTVELTAERAETHPKVLTAVTMEFRLTSPDASLKDLARAIDLSHTKYCSVSITIARSGCQIKWVATLIDPASLTTSSLTSDEFHAQAVQDNTN